MLLLFLGLLLVIFWVIFGVQLGTAMRNNLRSFVLVLFAMIIPLVGFAPKAFAVPTLYQSVPNCTGTDLENWDWVSGVKDTLGGTLTTFDNVNDSYIIYRVIGSYSSFTMSGGATYPATQQNKFYMIRSSSAMSLAYDSGTGLASVYYSGSLDKVFINSEAVTLNPSYAYYNSSLGIPSYALQKGQYVSNNGSYTYGRYSFDLSSSGIGASCVDVVHKVSYDTTFSDNFLSYTSVQSYTAVGKKGCSWSDISCQLSNVEIGFANAFVPDPIAMGDTWSNFTTFMSNKLGFLIFPFTFINNVLTAFNTAGSGCTNTSCVVVNASGSGSGFFGSHHFVLDLAEVSNNYPTLWAWGDGAIIGVTVLELIRAIHHKWQGVVKK